MKSMNYIGLDVGSSGCKAAVISGEGHIIALKRRSYNLHCPQKGYAELNPDEVWNAVIETLTELSPYATNAKTIAISSIGESLVMLGEGDEVLANGILYLDSRCADTTDIVREKISDDEMFKIAGVTIDPMYSLNHILWYRKNRPELLKRCKKIFLFGDYLSYRLCGKRAIDPSSASRTALFDTENLDWSDRIMEKFALQRCLFSPVLQTGTALGTLLTEIASLTGLPSSLEVVLGCHDQCAATLGAGVFQVGQAIISEGSSESINAVTSREKITGHFIREGLCYEPYVIPGLCLSLAAFLSHGSSINWFVKLFSDKLEKERMDESETLYEIAERLCAKSSESVFFFPYLSATAQNENKALGGFVGLDLGSEVGHLYHALLESLCFETAHNLRKLERSGIEVERIVATGGASTSALYMQMKADQLQQAIEVNGNTENGIVGLAMIGALACGDVSNYEEAARVFSAETREYLPHNENLEREVQYRKMLPIYKELFS